MNRVKEASKTYRKIHAAVRQWETDARTGKRGTYELWEIENHLQWMSDDPGAYDEILSEYGVTDADFRRYYKRTKAAS